jgi:hypothetical protein
LAVATAVGSNREIGRLQSSLTRLI